MHTWPLPSKKLNFDSVLCRCVTWRIRITYFHSPFPPTSPPLRPFLLSHIRLHWESWNKKTVIYTQKSHSVPSSTSKSRHVLKTGIKNSLHKDWNKKLPSTIVRMMDVWIVFESSWSDLLSVLLYNAFFL